ncbi:hypothetical protein SAMN05421819_0826 [Bryocella elongata]|uniref:Uncharacterized protein n=1 Tax=Bryocella elongata TaxID=863522 RepID=A0A1H5U1A9_9BACT|nr:hypothetical protein [Bryocella elongata]SEF68826.1 hypothetical protein SAMN05421819_0826 [Bryocella elongata]
MSRLNAFVIGAAMILATTVRCGAQQTACPYSDASSSKCVFFTMERFGLMVPAYTVVVLGDGEMKYWENAEPRSPAAQRAPWLKLTDGTKQTLVAAESSIRSGACMSHTRTMAFGGKTTMIAWSQEGYATCSFGASTDPTISAASTTFQAIAEMLQGGERLDRDHHGDRLALERDLDELIERAKSGKAIEPQLIATALESIANDDAVIDRVRQKANGLLHPAADAAPSAR